MDAATAAIEAARIAVIGTIVVGVLAMIGTLVGTLVAPFLIRRSDSTQEAERQRVEALREIVPALAEAGTQLRANLTGERRDEAVARLYREQTRLEMWLRDEEWPIGRIAQVGFIARGDDPSHSKKFLAASVLIAAWARGEITALEAKDRFNREAGVVLAKHTSMRDAR